MNSSYGGLHISVKNKRNKEASDEVYIQDKNMSASGKEFNGQKCCSKSLLKT